MTDERIIAYLLQELPEEDLERFEDECFAQESWPAEIELVEEDLIDAYLHHELNPERRQLFERNYLTTETRLERVNIAAALLRHLDKASKPAIAAAPAELNWVERFGGFWSSLTWGLRAATAVAIVAVIAGTVWFLRAPTPQTFAALSLSISSNNRAEGVQVAKVKLPPGTEALNISLTLPQSTPPAARYRVELENDDGDAKSAEVGGNDAQSVLVVVPAPQLARGEYALKLFVIKMDGSEERINGSYYFTVE